MGGSEKCGADECQSPANGTDVMVRKGRGEPGWSVLSCQNDDGRTLFSVYVGDELIVVDQPNPDAAVAMARRLMREPEASRRQRKGVAS